MSKQKAKVQEVVKEKKIATKKVQDSTSRQNLAMKLFSAKVTRQKALSKGDTK